MAGFEVRVRENVPMEARDGTVLRADVYSRLRRRLPGAAPAHPV